MTKTVAMLATDGFEQSELFEPLKALKDAGYTVHIVSIKEGKIKGWDSGQWGEAIAVDKLASEAKEKDYDALIIPGGVMNPDKLRAEKSVQKFIKDFDKNKVFQGENQFFPRFLFYLLREIYQK